MIIKYQNHAEIPYNYSVVTEYICSILNTSRAGPAQVEIRIDVSAISNQPWKVGGWNASNCLPGFSSPHIPKVVWFSNCYGSFSFSPSIA